MKRAFSIAAMNRLPVGLLGAAAAYVALRALILATSFDATALPMYELYPMGTMAELTMRGIDFPLRYYYDNAAGQILMGFLTVPVFALFGSSYLSLKLLPCAIGLATLVLVWRFLDRHFSRRAANLGAWLFAVGPPTLVKYSVICSGNHFENLFFTMLAAVCFYRWHAGTKTNGGLFLAAFTSGFALFVFLGALIPIGLFGGMHVGLRGWRRTLRDARVVLPGFIVGLMPLVIVNALTSARGLGFLGAKFASESSGRDAQVLQRTGEFLGSGLLHAGVFEPFLGLSGAALAVLFTLCFAIAYLASVPSAARGLRSILSGLVQGHRTAAEDAVAFESVKLVPFVLYLPLAALAFGISNFRLGGHNGPVEVAGYRYYLPTILFAIVLIAVWSARWWEVGGARRIAGAALGGATCLTGLSSLAIVDWSFAHAGEGSHYDGFNLAQTARGLLSSRNAVDDAEIVRRVEAMPRDVREQVVMAIGRNLGIEAWSRAHRKGASSATIDLDEMCMRWPKSWEIPFARGVGIGLRGSTRDAGIPLERALSEVYASIHATHWGLTGPGRWEAPLISWGIGFACTDVKLPPSSQIAALVAENDGCVGARFEENAIEFPLGHGILCGRILARGIPNDHAIVMTSIMRWAELQAVSRWEESGGRAFARGLGEGQAMETRDPLSVDVLIWIGTGERLGDEFWFGYGRGMFRRHGEGAVTIADRIAKVFGSALKEPFLRGVEQGRVDSH